ncbi:MAG: hypothetical protein AAF228_06385 [Pseudomonadota bacterium]
MAIDNYYGQKTGTTILQIFTEPKDGSESVIHRRLEDSEAYDTWHLSYYFKEVLEYKRLLEKSSIDFNDIPRHEKNLLLYLLFSANPEFKSITELGSSLFEMIDGFETIEKYISDQNSPLTKLPIKEFTYVGIELSEMLQLTSRVIHPEYKIELFDSGSSYNKSVDIVYDRSVTNYAYENVDELVAFAKSGQAGLLNTYFSFEETFQSSRLGKTLTYFSLDEFMSKIDKPFYHLFGTKAPGPYSGQDISGGRQVIEGFFLYGDQATIDNFMALSQKDPKVAQYFDEKEISPKDPFSLKPESLKAAS